MIKRKKTKVKRTKNKVKKKMFKRKLLTMRRKKKKKIMEIGDINLNIQSNLCFFEKKINLTFLSYYILCFTY